MLPAFRFRCFRFRCSKPVARSMFEQYILQHEVPATLHLDEQTVWIQIDQGCLLSPGNSQSLNIRVSLKMWWSRGALQSHHEGWTCQSLVSQRNWMGRTSLPDWSALQRWFMPAQASLSSIWHMNMKPIYLSRFLLIPLSWGHLQHLGYQLSTLPHSNSDYKRLFRKFLDPTREQNLSRSCTWQPPQVYSLPHWGLGACGWSS